MEARVGMTVGIFDGGPGGIVIESGAMMSQVLWIHRGPTDRSSSLWILSFYFLLDSLIILQNALGGLELFEYRYRVASYVGICIGRSGL